MLGIAAAFYLYVLYPDLPRRAWPRPCARRRGVLEAKYGFDDALRLRSPPRGCVGGSEQRALAAASTSRLHRRRGERQRRRRRRRARARVRLLQSGLVRGYALLILGGAVALLGYLLWALSERSTS